MKNKIIFLILFIIIKNIYSFINEINIWDRETLLNYTDNIIKSSKKYYIINPNLLLSNTINPLLIRNINDLKRKYNTKIFLFIIKEINSKEKNINLGFKNFCNEIYKGILKYYENLIKIFKSLINFIFNKYI